ncbi:battenin [Daktulosphaira vitifoliae]|uniref:battenin n=1 Tax=Daktulosphaira vitifoliae TaxID=58002 RepID=UPI0021A980DC|nr:battenin [Daktulosphaira vitifoliae]XP_050531537.1 battenin [Daktulosphaira vitifoliae]XP_050531538.1 battenin [Daktulosphaira vitifoliae]XP_050531539.1 battenin [Daktulosphaira vitifoliae]XP_050531540.1 battenin [Daktulosphaira vitifoliae]
MDTLTDQEKNLTKRRMVTLVSFFLLGLCNNFGYVVMLSSAHDILDTLSHSGNETSNSTKYFDGYVRECNRLSTGVILLADIIPGLLIKTISPFLALYINRRMVFCITLTFASFFIVANAKSELMATIGVALTSMSSGLGEPTLLAYMSYFDRSTITAWSSGTGGAGILGSLTYVTLTSFFGLSPTITMYLMLIVPIVMAVTFWVVLEHPNTDEVKIINNDSRESLTNSSITNKLAEKLSYIPSLANFMIPLCLVYFFEYLINQGLFELIYFKNISFSHNEQYRWYQVLYQVGVFISRSTVSFFPIEKLWILALLQAINFIFFLFQSLYSFTPSIYIIFALIAYEGLLGGSGYVNTYHNIAKKVPKEKQEFAMSITSLSDCLGITLAGFAAMPIHNTICQIPN